MMTVPPDDITLCYLEVAVMPNGEVLSFGRHCGRVTGPKGLGRFLTPVSALAPAPTPPVWSREWPTEPGDYWFYGWTHECAKGNPRMGLAQVCQIANGLAHIVRGALAYESDGAEGFWTRATLPDPPTEAIRP